MSVLLAASNNANAQTLESITKERKSLGNGPQIRVGKFPMDIQVNRVTNKIYVANAGSNSVSVIDSDSGGPPKIVGVGVEPTSIAIDDDSNKIYVANQGSDSVSVIDGHNDTKIRDIGFGVHVVSPGFSILGIYGTTMHIIYDKTSDKIYVANPESNTVSVIDGTTYSINNISGLKMPVYSVIMLPNFLFSHGSTIYVANYGNHTVSVIGGTTKPS